RSAAPGGRRPARVKLRTTIKDDPHRTDAHQLHDGAGPRPDPPGAGVLVRHDRGRPARDRLPQRRALAPNPQDVRRHRPEGRLHHPAWEEPPAARSPLPRAPPARPVRPGERVRNPQSMPHLPVRPPALRRLPRRLPATPPRPSGELNGTAWRLTPG